jgi:hypothetical protein
MEYGKVEVPELNVNNQEKKLVCSSLGTECHYSLLLPCRTEPTCSTTAKLLYHGFVLHSDDNTNLSV